MVPSQIPCGVRKWPSLPTTMRHAFTVSIDAYTNFLSSKVFEEVGFQIYFGYVYRLIYYEHRNVVRWTTSVPRQLMLHVFYRAPTRYSHLLGGMWWNPSLALNYRYHDKLSFTLFIMSIMIADSNTQAFGIAGSSRATILRTQSLLGAS